MYNTKTGGIFTAGFLRPNTVIISQLFPICQQLFSYNSQFLLIAQVFLVYFIQHSVLQKPFLYGIL